MNLPNKITISRIALIPVIIALFLIDAIPYGKFIATVLFVIAAATDFVDGYIARKYNMVTDTGKFLDPIADKALVMSGLLLIFQNPLVPIEYLILSAIIIIIRDQLVNSLRQVGVAKGCVIAAAWSGKIKTTVQDVAIVLIMFYSAIIQANWFSLTIKNAIWYLAVVALALAVFFTIYSMIDYFIKNRKILSNKEEKQEENNKE